MRTILLQLDSSPHASVFDRIVALDSGADEVISYGGVQESAVRDLVHGAIFTRGRKDLHRTALFVGGVDMDAGERLLSAVQKAFIGPLRVSVLLDPNGANTTAVAAVVKLHRAVGELTGRRVLVTGGTGPVGLRASGLLAQAGAEVTITVAEASQEADVTTKIAQRFGKSVRTVIAPDSSRTTPLLESADLVLNAGRAGMRLVERAAWWDRGRLHAIADLNAVPPLGIEGIEVTDDGGQRGGVTAYGAFGIGALKMKIHRACIVRLFERNDLVLDAETIAEIAGQPELSST